MAGSRRIDVGQRRVVEVGTESQPRTAFSKALNVLQLVLAGEEGVRVNRVADELSMPQSTARRLLRHLEDSDFVSEHHGSYVPGRRLNLLINGHISVSSINEVSSPILDRLQSATGETAICAVRSGLHGVIVREAQSRHLHNVSHRRGQSMPLYAGALQRALLAFSSQDVLQAVLDSGLTPVTENTLSKARLIASLESIRQTGIALSREELELGHMAIAIAVSVGGEVVCSLGISCPTVRWRKDREAPTVKELRAAAQVMREMLVA
jgi:IclR family transcriptional regulator, KDG regulon repressor